MEDRTLLTKYVRRDVAAFRSRFGTLSKEVPPLGFKLADAQKAMMLK